MSFNIVRNATPVPLRTGKGRKLAYPYDKLNVGDALEFSDLTKTEQVARLRELQSAYSYARKHAKTFSLRTTTDGVIQLLRVA